VTLKEGAPHGYLKDQLTLVTNDANFRTARVPIPIEGIITAPISVRPLPLLLGTVPAGQSITRPLVMQSITPFKVVRVQCSDPRFQFRLPATVQSVQLIPVTFAAGDVPGNVDQVIHIETDASSAAAVDVPVQARVIAPATTVREESGDPGRPGGNSGTVLGARNDSGWGPSHDEPGARPSGTAAEAPLPAPRVQSPVPATRGAPVVESPAAGKKGAAETDRSSPGLAAGKWNSPGWQTLPPGARPSAGVPAVAPAAINPPFANRAPANDPAASGTPNATKHPPLPWDSSSPSSSPSQSP
jgi:hypothetical protein